MIAVTKTLKIRVKVVSKFTKGEKFLVYNKDYGYIWVHKENLTIFCNLSP